ncbi:MAG: DMT family transporter [Actinomycetia bacterium]|nr:DMT family transporter [Actinomycetes bacterium]
MAAPLTNVGSRTGAYGASEWGLTLVIGIIWGSAFLWIAVGVDHFSPGVVAFGRVALGAGALAMFSRARRRIDRADWSRVFVVAVVGNAAPALLYSTAETSLDSAVAGMVTAGVPIVSLVIAAVLLRQLPGRAQAIGITLGFVGIFMMTLPSLRGTHADPVGVGLVLLAVIGYGISGNLLVPLQQRYGGLAVTMWALVLSSFMLFPFAIATAGESDFAMSSLVAVVILGVVGTGIVRALGATLAGRVGAPRMSTTAYLIPVFAIVLGVVFRDEVVLPVAIVGVVVVLVGAFVATRAVTVR